jgi:type VI secretion system secreted protein VgrG
MGLLDQATGGLTSKLPDVSGMGGLSGHLQDFLRTSLSQATRLLELVFSADSGIPSNKLLVHRLTGWEEINTGFRYEVQVLSDDAFIALKDLEGLPVQLTILTARGTQRQISGVVTEVHSEGTDGALASYRLIVEPVTAALKLSRSSRVFLGLSYFEAALSILNEQLQGNPVFSAAFSLDNRCRGSFPTREFIFLCDESPWDFIRRCFFKEGVAFVFAPAKGSAPEHPQHSLILFNDARDLDANEAREVRFHRVDGTEETDAITAWHARRTLQCGRVARRTWYHNTGSLGTTSEDLQSDQGTFGNALASTLEEYRHETPLEHDDAGVFETKTATHAQVREQRTKTFAGEGSVRDFRAEAPSP